MFVRHPTTRLPRVDTFWRPIPLTLGRVQVHLHHSPREWDVWSGGSVEVQVRAVTDDGRDGHSPSFTVSVHYRHTRIQGGGPVSHPEVTPVRGEDGFVSLLTPCTRAARSPGWTSTFLRTPTPLPRRDTPDSRGRSLRTGPTRPRGTRPLLLSGHRSTRTRRLTRHYASLLEPPSPAGVCTGPAALST